MRSSRSLLSKRARWYPPAQTIQGPSDESNSSPNFQTQRTRPSDNPMNLDSFKKHELDEDIEIEVEEEEETLENDDIQEYKDFQTRERGSQSQFGDGYGSPSFYSNIR